MNDELAKMLIDELRVINQWLSVINQTLTNNNTTIVEEIAYNKVEPETIEKTLKVPGMAKLPPEINKSTLDFNKVHKIGKTPCTKCLGPITWEYRPGIAWPIHVDEMGKIIGNGTCPEYGGS